MARFLTIRFVAAGALAAFGGSSLAADWRQWRGPNRDGTTVRVTLPAKWPAALKQVWEKKIGAGVTSL